MRRFAFYGTGNPCAPVSPSAFFRSVFTELTEDATMPRVKQASKQKRTTKAATVKMLGAAGLGLSLASSASASTMPAAGITQSDNTLPNQRFFLGEEEMADVSLATFHLFDRENFGSRVQLARGGCGGGGGGGCGHGGGGCGHGGGGFGGCGHGGGFGGGCGHVGGGFVGGRGCGGGGGLVVGGRGCGGFRGCGGGGLVVGGRGCGGFRGCRGFRGCGCGGCGFVGWGLVGWGYDDWGYDDGGYGDWGYGACCASWGACRPC